MTEVCTLDVPLAFSPPLEDYVVPDEKDGIAAVKELMIRENVG